VSVANYLVRRQAVYYFRRRLPKVVQGRNPAHVFLSLRTRDPVRARRLASYVRAAFEDLVMSAETHFLTKTQLDGLLRAVVDDRSRLQNFGNRLCRSPSLQFDTEPATLKYHSARRTPHAFPPPRFRPLEAFA
jgi:hypothetical protein